MTYIAASAFVWIFILVPLLVIWAIGLFDVLRRDLPRGTKAAWILIVVLLPLLGTLLYFLLRKPTPEEARLQRAATAASPRDRRPGIGPRPPVD